MQVLAAAASNVAVDNLVERLTAADPKLVVVRAGHPARLLPQVWYVMQKHMAKLWDVRYRQNIAGHQSVTYSAHQVKRNPAV